MTTNDVHPSPEPESPAPTDVPGEQVIVAATVTEPTPQEQADQIAGAVGRNWGVLLSLGLLMGALGVAVMVWPQATIGVIAVLLGIALLISGVFSLIAGITRKDQPTSLRALAVISGVLSLGLGIFALSGLTEAVTLLALMIGFGWIVRGIGDLMLGIGSKGMRGRGLTITAGVIGVIAGIVVLAWPGITLLALAYVSGIWLIVLGILQIVMAFRIRKVANAADLQEVIKA